DPRMRSLVLALARKVGCQPVPDLPQSNGDPAIWITERVADLEQRAAEFRSGRRNRQVFVLSDDELEIDGVCATTLTGAEGLAVQLRRFLTRLSDERTN